MSLPASPQLWVPHLRAQFCPALRWAGCYRWLLAISLLILFLTSAAHAQGCAQCLDSTRATPPAVQASYRHAIYLLGGVGAAFFIAGLLLFRREQE